MLRPWSQELDTGSISLLRRCNSSFLPQIQGEVLATFITNIPHGNDCVCQRVLPKKKIVSTILMCTCAILPHTPHTPGLPALHCII